MTTHKSNFSDFFTVSPYIMRPKARHFWGEDLIRSGLAILYQVLHSFYRVFWVMRLGQKIKGLIEDHPEALYGFQWNNH